MKASKLLAAGSLALAVAGTVSAQQIVRVTGSTAFRGAVERAIYDSLTAPSGAAGVLVGQTGSSMDSAAAAVFVGMDKTHNLLTIVKTAWTGSVGGIQVLAQNIAAAKPFINTPVNMGGGVWTVDGVALTVPAAGSDTGTNIATSSQVESHTADMGMADCSPSVAGYVGGLNLALNDSTVGVVPFEWVGAAWINGVNSGSTPPTGITNITKNTAVSLLNGGVLATQITGNPADTYGCFVIGRDHDSGTRVAALLDCQFPGGVYGTVSQYIANGDSVGPTQFSTQTNGTGTISTLSPWPAESVLGVNNGAGTEGWFSGGNVAADLNRACDLASSTGGYDISYCGMGDANHVNPGTGVSYTDSQGRTSNITPSQNALLFNGQYPGTALHPFAPPYTNIIEGVYEFWGYEHSFYHASEDTGNGGGPTNVALLATEFRNQIAAEADYVGTGITLAAMHCTRVEGGLITHN